MTGTSVWSEMIGARLREKTNMGPICPSEGETTYRSKHTDQQWQTDANPPPQAWSRFQESQIRGPYLETVSDS